MSDSVSSSVALIAKDAGPLGAIARALAAMLDDPDESSPAAVAKELRATLLAIADLKPAVEDPVDQLKIQRVARRAKVGRSPTAKSS